MLPKLDLLFCSQVAAENSPAEDCSTDAISGFLGWCKKVGLELSPKVGDRDDGAGCPGSLAGAGNGWRIRPIHLCVRERLSLAYTAETVTSLGWQENRVAGLPLWDGAGVAERATVRQSEG